MIGRPDIALGELAKNSFDADATICRIEFTDDHIVISDNGTGMSRHMFLTHWMRLFTTHKIDQAISPKLGRPLTGSKGIGRLSAQFLSHEMTLESTSEDNPDESLYAMVDWRHARRTADLDTVQVLWEVKSTTCTYPGNSRSGTRITLNLLKSTWDTEDIRDLGNNLWLLRSPFKRLQYKSPITATNQFEIELNAPTISGAKAAFDETIDNVLANWQARIEGTLEHGRSGHSATIHLEFRPDYPSGSEKSRKFKERVVFPVATSDKPLHPLVDTVRFQILVYQAKGRQPHSISVGDLRSYLVNFGNVSVYDAGFRLPYYGSGGDKSGQDWLGVTADQGRRLSTSPLLPERLQSGGRYMLDLPSPRRLIGAVEIDTNHERTAAVRSGDDTQPRLEIQPGRDRLKANEAFAQLRDLVRYSLDFYASRFRMLALTAAEATTKDTNATTEIGRAIQALERSKDEIPQPVVREIRRHLNRARTTSRATKDAADSRAVLLAPLAAAGMAAIALRHELIRENRSLGRVISRILQVAEEKSLPELRDSAHNLAEYQRRVDALDELFAPLLYNEDREATDRLKVRAVVEQSLRGMKPLMPGVRFNDTVTIPEDLLFPRGSLAEWNAILQNVLANAWNAMLDSDKAHMSFVGAGDKRGNRWLRISDTGQGLDLPIEDTHKLFDPFERRINIGADKQSIAIGGQGLGLAIVRMIAHRRATRAGFVRPQAGYSTTFELSWRGGRR